MTFSPLQNSPVVSRNTNAAQEGVGPISVRYVVRMMTSTFTCGNRPPAETNFGSTTIEVGLTGK